MNRRAALAAALAFAVAPALAQAPDPLAGRFGGPFALTAHDGRRVTEADFRGRHMLMFFGYTHCPDVCPVDLAIMAEALERIGPRARHVQPVFVTVDPARDTPDVLREFVASFDPRILGLTGSEAEIAAVTKAWRVHRAKYVSPQAQGDDYFVDHGSLTYLMGPDGGFRTLIPHGGDAAGMAAVLRRYLPD